MFLDLPIPKRFKSINYTLTAFISLGVMIFGILFGYFLFPMFLKKMVKGVRIILFNFLWNI